MIIRRKTYDLIVTHRQILAHHQGSHHSAIRLPQCLFPVSSAHKIKGFIPSGNELLTRRSAGVRKLNRPLRCSVRNENPGRVDEKKSFVERKQWKYGRRKLRLN